MMRPTTYLIATLAITVLLSVISLSQESREVLKSVSLRSDGQVYIDTYKGSITVTAWDKPTVEIHATIESDEEFGDKYSADRVRETEIVIDATEHSVRIKTDYDKIKKHRSGFWSFFDDNGSLPLVHYVISMPVTANLQIKDYKSQTTISGLRSDIDLNTYKGEAEITDLEGSLQLNTYKGEAKVSFSKMTHRNRFETYKGNVSITVPKSLGFDLDADLGYRTDFHSDFELENQTSSKRHRDVEYRGFINGGGASLVLRSTKGSVSLRRR